MYAKEVITQPHRRTLKKSLLTRIAEHLLHNVLAIVKRSVRDSDVVNVTVQHRGHLGRKK